MNKTDLHPWQSKLLVDIESGGFKPGEMSIMMAGRQMGKSTFTQHIIQAWMDELAKPKPISDLILDTGTVYGNRYYTVSPKGGNWKLMEAWCTETFGKHGGSIWGADPKKAPLPNERWYMNNSKFWFRSPKDRDWFIMRWSAT